MNKGTYRSWYAVPIWAALALLIFHALPGDSERGPSAALGGVDGSPPVRGDGDFADPKERAEALDGPRVLAASLHQELMVVDGETLQALGGARLIYRGRDSLSLELATSDPEGRMRWEGGRTMQFEGDLLLVREGFLDQRLPISKLEAGPVVVRMHPGGSGRVVVSSAAGPSSAVGIEGVLSTDWPSTASAQALRCLPGEVLEFREVRYGVPLHLRLAMPPFHEWSGTVVFDANAPQVEIELEAAYPLFGVALDSQGRPVDGLEIRRQSPRSGSFSTCRTREDGSFTFSGVPPGSHLLIGGGVVLATVEVLERPDNFVQVVVGAGEGRSSRLVVAPGGQPAIGIEVVCLERGRRRTEAVRTDADGRFTLRVPTGAGAMVVAAASPVDGLAEAWLTFADLEALPEIALTPVGMGAIALPRDCEDPLVVSRRIGNRDRWEARLAPGETLPVEAGAWMVEGVDPGASGSSTSIQVEAGGRTTLDCSPPDARTRRLYGRVSTSGVDVPWVEVSVHLAPVPVVGHHEGPLPGPAGARFEQTVGPSQEFSFELPTTLLEDWNPLLVLCTAPGAACQAPVLVSRPEDLERAIDLRLVPSASLTLLGLESNQAVQLLGSRGRERTTESTGHAEHVRFEGLLPGAHYRVVTASWAALLEVAQGENVHTVPPAAGPAGGAELELEGPDAPHCGPVVHLARAGALVLARPGERISEGRYFLTQPPAAGDVVLGTSTLTGEALFFGITGGSSGGGFLGLQAAGEVTLVAETTAVIAELSVLEAGSLPLEAAVGSAAVVFRGRVEPGSARVVSALPAGRLRLATWTDTGRTRVEEFPFDGLAVQRGLGR